MLCLCRSPMRYKPAWLLASPRACAAGVGAPPFRTSRLGSYHANMPGSWIAACENAGVVAELTEPLPRR